MQNILNKKRKGFTLIELIVVIAIIGILVLLAMPKFMDYTKEAKMAQIKHDIKVTETIMDEYLSIESKLPEGFEMPDMDTPLAEGRLFETRGEATAIIGDAADYRDVTTMDEVLSIRSKLDGQFVANEHGNVYYIHDKAINIGETLPDLAIAEDQPYMDESVPTLGSIGVWGEDSKEVLALVIALDSMGVTPATQEDAYALYEDLKANNTALLTTIISVQPQIWSGHYNEAVTDLNNIRTGLEAWLIGLFGTLIAGENTFNQVQNEWNFENIKIGVQLSDYNGYGFNNRMQLFVNDNPSYIFTTNNMTAYYGEILGIEPIKLVVNSPTLITLHYRRIMNYESTYIYQQGLGFESGMSTGTYVPDEIVPMQISISADAPILDGSYDASTDRRYPEAPWLGAYSDTWQDVKMAKSGNKDIYLGTIDRYINDIVNVLTWDNIDVSSVSYYGGGSATTTLSATPDGLLEVTVPE